MFNKQRKMRETQIMQELELIINLLKVEDNTLIINKVKKVMEDLEFYFSSSEYYAQEINKIINDSQS